VRRETLDHPGIERVVIQDECSHCHMPIVEYQAAQFRIRKAELFSRLPFNADNKGQCRSSGTGSPARCVTRSPKRTLALEPAFVGNFRNRFTGKSRISAQSMGLSLSMQANQRVMAEFQPEASFPGEGHAKFAIRLFARLATRWYTNSLGGKGRQAPLE